MQFAVSHDLPDRRSEYIKKVGLPHIAFCSALKFRLYAQPLQSHHPNYPAPSNVSNILSLALLLTVVVLLMGVLLGMGALLLMVASLAKAANEAAITGLRGQILGMLYIHDSNP